MDPERHGLAEADLLPDPIDQFARWMADAQGAGLLEPTAAALATVSPDGRPSVRMVLLKSFDRSGFSFFTNYESRKGRDLAANPRAALTFWWDRLQRQVRIEGAVERVSAEESSDYFASRPRGSQLGAHASPQSQVLSSRQELDARARTIESKFPDGTTVPRPDHWGGFRIVPNEIEFWQGRPDRLHDRLRYRREIGPEARGWRLERLAP